MSYFDNFPLAYYKFGDNEPEVIWQNISAYIDLLDQLSDQTAFYDLHFIMDGDRPDTLSYKLYEDVEYYWSFYLINPHLRLSGWPLTNQMLQERARESYPHWTITTTGDISGPKFVAGQTVRGGLSATVGTIIENNLELGQLVVDTRGYTTKTFERLRLRLDRDPETGQYFIDLTRHDRWRPNYTVKSVTAIWESDPNNIITPSNIIRRWDTSAFPDGKIYLLFERQEPIPNSNNDRLWVTYDYEFYSNNNFQDNETVLVGTVYDDLVSVPLIGAVEQYNSVHHYTDTQGEYVDIDPFSPRPTGLIPVTYYDRMVAKNDELREIKIIRPDAINQVTTEFRKLLKGL
jgi:hypothetical protein